MPKHRGIELETADVPARQVPTREGYDLWAQVYDDEANPLVALDELVVAPRLGALAGLDLLDLGCGTGRWSGYAARQGAAVVGVDFAGEMLVRARVNLAGTGVRLVQADLARPLPFPDQCFDRVISGLVLEHIAEPATLFAEARRVCRAAGRLVFSTMHPVLFEFGKQAHFVDRATGVEVRFQSYAHQLADFVAAAEQAGLAFDAVEEHQASNALAARHPALRKFKGVPVLLTLSLRPG